MKKQLTHPILFGASRRVTPCFIGFALIILAAATAAAQVPTIATFAPTKGNVGTVVTLAGTNFSPTAANNAVFFGATRATVSAATATSLTVTVPSGATYAPITVINKTTRLAAYSLANFTPTFSPHKGSITGYDFATRVDFGTGVAPYSVAIGDIDGDGKPDVVLGNVTSGTVSILRNTGSSGTVSFATKVDITAVANPYSLTIGDINGDGKLDIAVGNYIGNTISVLQNTGSSGIISFAPIISCATGTNPYSIVIGDIDGDGKPDVATANIGNASISVLRNTSMGGAISFAPRIDITVGTSPYYIAIGDIDGDGKLDLATANYNTNTISVLENTSSSGLISFAPNVDFATGINPQYITIGDIDGDGKPDVATANVGDNTVSVLRNTSSSGTITFAIHADMSTAQNPTSVAISDLDGDGKPDLATSNASNHTVSVLQNTGNMGSISFAAKLDFGTGANPYGIAIDDIDGDGKPDLVAANISHNSVSVIRNIATALPPTVSGFAPATGIVGATVTITGTNFYPNPTENAVFFGATRATVTAATATSLTVTVPSGASYAPIAVLNTGTVMAASSVTYFNPIYTAHKETIATTDFAPKTDAATNTNSYSVAISDIDGDGKPDMAVTNSSNATVSVLRNTGSSFAPKIDFTTGAAPYSVALADIDNDGKPDLVVANYNGNSVSVLRNTSSGAGVISFAAKADKTTGLRPANVKIGDLDGDGKLDIVTTNYNSNTVSVLRNTSTGAGIVSFAAKIDFATAANPISLVIGDLDGDGKPDVAVTNYGNASVSVLRNTSNSGAVSFATRVNFTVGSNPKSIAISDINADGKNDLVVANYTSSTVSVLRNTSSAGKISFAAKLDKPSGTNPSSIAIGDFDADGKPDIAVANYTSNTLSILQNTSGAGISFAAKIDLPTGTNPISAAVADLNADGKLDIAVANYTSNTVSVIRNTPLILPPTITAFSPATAVVGATVTITGSNFHTNPNNNSVFFGATRATVSAATATSLSVTVPSGASFAPITVLNAGTVLAGYSAADFLPTFGAPHKPSINTADFAVAIDNNTDINPISAKIADIDGDGKPDIVVANSGSNTISVLRNTNNGSAPDFTAPSFATALPFATGENPYNLAIDDLDGDGKLDIAVTNFADNTVSVLRNTSSSGAVSFAAKIDFATGANPVAVAITDINADGKPDLVVADYGIDSVSVLRNTSTEAGISFAAKTDIACGASPISLAVADLNGDNKPDIIALNSVDNTVSVLRNTNSGNALSFATKIDLPTGANPSSIAIGDLDGDGKLDMATANFDDNTVSVLRNTNSGSAISFATKVDLPTGTNPNSIAIADFDGDNKPDLSTANFDDNTVSVLRNTDAMTFAAPVNIATGLSPVAIAVGDLNTDGMPDIVTANISSNTVSVIQNAPIFLPPIITAFTPAMDEIGTIITITGDNFNVNAADNVVYFGATRATVSAATATSLTVTVPLGASYAPIYVLNAGTLLSAYSTSNFTPTYSPYKGMIAASDFAPKVDLAATANPFGAEVVSFKKKAYLCVF